MAEKKEKKYIAASDDTKAPRKQAKEVGNAGPLRIGAVVLWAIALILEVCALMVFLGKLDLKFLPQMAQLIGFLVLDLVCVIAGSTLWKKANHIDPASEQNQVKFWLWNNMGVIVASVAFVPFAILALTDKNADKKTKTIATVAAVICLMIGGVASYDFNPVSSEKKAAAVDTLGGQTVYWTTFGKVYHTHDDCSHLNQSETLTYGTVEQAIANNRVRLCKTCANRDGITTVTTE
jgi:hypothetical protein